jgi:hypothetical protein
MKGIYYAMGLLLVFGAVFAAAAVLDINPSVLQAGSDDVLQCDTDGVFVDGWGYENDTLSVTYVRIGGINADACNGKEMHVDVYPSPNGLGTSLGGGFWQITGGGNPVMHTFSFGGSVDAQAIEEIHIAITD